jgi:hypothetical protein
LLVENLGEELRKIDPERRQVQRGTPFQLLGEDLRSLVRRPPALDQPGIEIHDPALGHAVPLVAAALQPVRSFREVAQKFAKGQLTLSIGRSAAGNELLEPWVVLERRERSTGRGSTVIATGALSGICWRSESGRRSRKGST